jgi:hypothetical protein
MHCSKTVQGRVAELLNAELSTRKAKAQEGFPVGCVTCGLGLWPRTPERRLRDPVTAVAITANFIYHCIVQLIKEVIEKKQKQEDK